MKSIFLSFVFLLTATSTLLAQSGKITGKVIDAKSGETLPGASVLIEGTTKGAATDFDGNYSISVEPGMYSVICKYVSYSNKVIKDIEVKAGDVINVSFSMEEPKGDTLGEVTITATMSKENTNAVLIMQKNNASVSDGISAENIKKTPDRNTSDVLKRVSGASIQDNKFAIIRGMNDRYNAAFINGAPLPSTESDRKAFSFDIFPANMLDNLIIMKTATPDMPGDFAGGVIMINTKDIPDKNQQTISIGGGYNGLTTGKDFYVRDAKNKYAWLGLDDGKRALPEDMPSYEDYKKITNNLEKTEYARKMMYDWGIKTKKAMPNMNLQYTLAQNFKLFKKQSGLLFALTYQNNLQTNYQQRNEYDITPTGSIKTLEFNDTVSNRNTLSSALLNFAYKFNENNQISIKNLASINSDDRVTVRQGLRNANDPDPYHEKSSVRWFTQNIFYTSQLTGDHILGKSKIKLKWTGGYSGVKRTVPAMNRNVYQINSSGKYIAQVIDNSDPQGGGNMFFSNTNEEILSLRYDFTIPASIKKINNEIKVGGYHQIRGREFSARQFKFAPYKKGTSVKANDSILYLPDAEIFDYENMGVINAPKPYTGGFKLNEITKASDSYNAGSVLHAAYAMFDTKFFNYHRIVWGARMESYNQHFDYVQEATNESTSIDTNVVDILPSVNYIYSISKTMNLRASYYRTVSRPEFRELAPFAFYNFIQLNIWSGDPKLKRALIDNFDLRYEIYPGAGQVLSVTGFYKNLNNPIEAVQRTGVSGDPELYYTNVPGVTNIGGELEYRIKLGVFTKNDSAVFLNNTTVFTNFSYIKSEVNNSNIIGQSKRPLQGQSPYLINAGIQFLHPTKDWSMSLSYNVVGQRIFVVGNVQEFNIWEKQRNVIDFQLTKTFKKKLELKFNVRDMVGQDQIFYQNTDENDATLSTKQKRKSSKYQEGKDDVVWRVKYAPTFSMGISYKF